MDELNGLWMSRYTYSGGEGLHRVNVVLKADQVSVESLPNEEGSTLRMKLKLHKNVLKGTWGELTSPTGAYAGQFFEGFVIFVLNNKCTKAEGTWVGTNRDNNRVNSGTWMLERLLDKEVQ